MRKHFYLVTEHEDESRVGGAKIFDSRMTKPLKNEEGPITVFNEDEASFRDIGMMVGMGYADFEDEDDYEETVGEVIREKLAEIDEEYLRKAGLEPQEVLPA